MLSKLATVSVGILLSTIASASTDVSRPNVLVIVADDLAYTDLGAFGGEIETPNLDKLANSGVKLTSFYTAPTCSPTRAMLMTGRDAHEVGLGTMGEVLYSQPHLRQAPGYTGFLDPNVPTIADNFAAAGYRTLMAGKWHLGHRPEHSAKARGFQRSFVLVQGGGDHFGAYQKPPGKPGRSIESYQENGAPARFPQDAFSSDFYTTKILEYVTESQNDNRPFFAYLAFTAPHWPIQAPDNIIDKYKGRYDDGPAVMQAKRLARLKAIGDFEASMLKYSPGNFSDWNSKSDTQRAVESRGMEVYAAMVDNLDQNVGRVLATLETSNQLKNTIIVFLSDNGAEGVTSETLNGYMAGAGHSPDTFKKLSLINADPKLVGRPGSYYTYGPEWAQASTGPFRNFKGTTYEGGIRTPAFIYGPSINGGRTVSSLATVRDLMPTLQELANVSATPAGGRSWVGLLDNDPETQIQEAESFAWELFFQRAVRWGNWKAVYSKLGNESGAEKWQWQLYNLSLDPSEQNDLSQQEPEVMEEIYKIWERYQSENGVQVM